MRESRDSDHSPATPCSPSHHLVNLNEKLPNEVRIDKYLGRLMESERDGDTDRGDDRQTDMI